MSLGQLVIFFLIYLKNISANLNISVTSSQKKPPENK